MNSTDYSSYVNELFERTITALLKSKKLSDLIVKAAMSMINSFNSGGKVLLIGNGGSASDASHMAGELIGRYRACQPQQSGVGQNRSSRTEQMFSGLPPKADLRSANL